MTNSVKRNTKLWLAESSNFDSETKKVIERMGMSVAEFTDFMEHDTGLARSRTSFVWPKHTFREIRDPAEMVYQHETTDTSWSVRYKALGCVDLPSLSSIQIKQNPKYSEHSGLFPQIDKKPQSTANTPVHVSGLVSDVLLKRSELGLTDDRITSEQRNKLMADLQLSESEDDEDEYDAGLDEPKERAISESNQSPSDMSLNSVDVLRPSHEIFPDSDSKGPAICLLPQRPKPESIDVCGKNITLPITQARVSPLPIELVCCTKTIENSSRSRDAELRNGTSEKSQPNSRGKKSGRSINELKHSSTSVMTSTAKGSVSSPAKVSQPLSYGGNEARSKQRNGVLDDSIREQYNKENLANARFLNAKLGNGKGNESALNIPLGTNHITSPESSAKVLSAEDILQVIARADNFKKQSINLMYGCNVTDDLLLEGGELDSVLQADHNDKLDIRRSRYSSKFHRKSPFVSYVSPLPTTSVNNDRQFIPKSPQTGLDDAPRGNNSSSNVTHVPHDFPKVCALQSETEDRLKSDKGNIADDNAAKDTVSDMLIQSKRVSISQPHAPFHSEPQNQINLKHSQKSCDKLIRDKLSMQFGSPKSRYQEVRGSPRLWLNDADGKRSSDSVASMPPPHPSAKRKRSDYFSKLGENLGESVSVKLDTAKLIPTDISPSAPPCSDQAPANGNPLLRPMPSSPWILSSLPADCIRSQIPKIFLHSKKSSPDDRLKSLRFILRNLRVDGSVGVSVRPLTGVLIVPPNPSLAVTFPAHNDATTMTSPVVVPSKQKAEVSVQFSAATVNLCTQVSPRLYSSVITNTSPHLEQVEACIGTSPSPLRLGNSEKYALEEALHRTLKHNQELIALSVQSLTESNPTHHLNKCDQLRAEAATCWSNLVEFVAITSKGNKKRSTSLVDAAVKSSPDPIKVCSCGVHDGKSLLHFLFRQVNFTAYPEKMLSLVRYLISAAHLLESRVTTNVGGSSSAESQQQHVTSTPISLYGQAIDLLQITENRLKRAEGKLLRRALTAATNQRKTGCSDSVAPPPVVDSVSVRDYGAEEWSNLWYSALPRIASFLYFREYEQLRQRANDLRAKIEEDEYLRDANLENDFLIDSPQRPPQRLQNPHSVRSVNRESADTGMCTLPVSTVERLFKFYRVSTLAHESVLKRVDSEQFVSTDRYACFGGVVGASALSQRHVQATVTGCSSFSPTYDEASALLSAPELPVFVAPTGQISTLLNYIDGVLRANKRIVARLSYCPEAAIGSALATGDHKRNTCVGSSLVPVASSHARSPESKFHSKSSKKSVPPRPPRIPSTALRDSLSGDIERKHKRIKSPTLSSLPSGESVASPPSSSGCSPVPLKKTRLPSNESVMSKVLPRIKKRKVSEASEDTDRSVIDFNEPKQFRRSKKRVANEVAREQSTSSVEAPEILQSRKLQLSNKSFPNERTHNHLHTSHDRRSRSKSVAPERNLSPNVSSSKVSDDIVRSRSLMKKSEEFNARRYREKSVPRSVSAVIDGASNTSKQVSASDLSLNDQATACFQPGFKKKSRETHLPRSPPAYSPSRPGCSNMSTSSSNSAAYKPSVRPPERHQYIPSVPKSDNVASSGTTVVRRTLIPDPPSLPTGRVMPTGNTKLINFDQTTGASRTKYADGNRLNQKPHR